MGRPGISYSDVANTAQQLAARGTNPTIESIRVVLKTGSSSTIAQHLRTWKAKQDGLQQTAIKENLPEALVAVMKGLWEKVLDQAEEQISSIKQSTDKIVLQCRQDLSLHQQESRQVQHQYNQLQQEIKQQSQEKQALEQQMATQHLENATLQAKCEGLIQQLNEKQIRVDELNRLDQQVQANLEHYRQASLEQRQLDQQQALHRQQQLEQALIQVQNEAKTHQQQLSQQEQQSERYRLEVEHLRADHDQVLLDNEALQRRWIEQTKILSTLEKEQASFTQKLLILEASRAELLSENKQLTQENWRLSQDKTVLTFQLKEAGDII